MTLSFFRRGKTYWARVPRIGGTSTQRSLGTENREAAADICKYLGWLKARREAWLLHELAGGRIRIAAAYAAYLEERTDAFIAEMRDGAQDTPLESMIPRWVREMERRKRPSPSERAKYERQVRTLINTDGGVTRRSELTRPRIREWLADLSVGQPNRYRAALSNFCNFLILEEVLNVNPVLAIPASREREPRSRHLTPDDALALLKSIDPAVRGIHALMMATGIEVGAALTVRRRDVDLSARTVFARGTKRAHRQRTCTVYDRWRGAWALVRKHMQGDHGTPDAKLFDVSYYAVRDGLQRALVAREVDDYTTHDHRHTWAVQAIRDGLAIQTVSHQLGHRDAVMTLRVYGKFIPSKADFAGAKTRTATKGATT